MTPSFLFLIASPYSIDRLSITAGNLSAGEHCFYHQHYSGRLPSWTNRPKVAILFISSHKQLQMNTQQGRTIMATDQLNHIIEEVEQLSDEDLQAAHERI